MSSLSDFLKEYSEEVKVEDTNIKQNQNNENKIVTNNIVNTAINNNVDDKESENINLDNKKEENLFNIKDNNNNNNINTAINNNLSSNDSDSNSNNNNDGGNSNDNDKKHINVKKKNIKLNFNRKSSIESGGENDVDDKLNHDSEEKNKENNTSEQQDINKITEENKNNFSDIKEYLIRDTNIDNININADNDNYNHDKDKKQDELSEELIEKLFVESETDINFKEKWIELYKKALESDKKTLTNNKVRRGRFRLDEKGKLIILSDFNTYNKSSKDLLHDNWFSNK